MLSLHGLHRCAAPVRITSLIVRLHLYWRQMVDRFGAPLLRWQSCSFTSLVVGIPGRAKYLTHVMHLSTVSIVINRVSHPLRISYQSVTVTTCQLFHECLAEFSVLALISRTTPVDQFTFTSWQLARAFISAAVLGLIRHDLFIVSLAVISATTIDSIIWSLLIGLMPSQVGSGDSGE